MQGFLLSESQDVQGWPTLQAWAAHVNPYMSLEILAQAYMMSAEVRRAAQDLSPPARLQLLYRLQAGTRQERDIQVLQSMNENQHTCYLAFAVYRLNVLDSEDASTRDAREAMVVRRRLRARDGNHSRQDLDNRRRKSNLGVRELLSRQANETAAESLDDLVYPETPLTIPNVSR